MPEAQREAVQRLENFLMFPKVPKLPVSGSTEEAPEGNGEFRMGTMGATGIEPMTSTVSR